MVSITRMGDTGTRGCLFGSVGLYYAVYDTFGSSRNVYVVPIETTSRGGSSFGCEGLLLAYIALHDG